MTKFIVASTLVTTLNSDIIPIPELGINCGQLMSCGTVGTAYKKAINKIDNSFLKNEKKVADKFNTEVVPMYSAIDKLQKEITSSQKQTEAIQSELLLVDIEISKYLDIIKEKENFKIKKEKK